MKAIVLAAGLGTRLRPFTCATPKPLMPVWGETMLDRIVDMLRSWGVDDFAFNTHHLHEQVEAWADALKARFAERGEKVAVRTSFEPEILGSGGALNPLREWIAGESFLLVNGDIVVDGLESDSVGLGSDKVGLGSGSVELGSGSVGKTLNDFKVTLNDPNVIAAAIVTEEGPRTIEVEPESGFVTNWKSDDRGYPGTFTYAGIALLKPEILDFVEPQGFSSIIAAYEKAMMEGKFVKAIEPKEMRWADAGTIESYIDLNRDGDDNAFAAIPQVAAACARTRLASSVGGSQDTLGAPSCASALAPKIEFLGARGSERVFFRHEGEIIILYDDAKRKENAKYAGHARWLKAQGIPVPEILADIPEQKTLVMEFAGVEKKMTLVDYAKVVEALVKFNQLGSDKVGLGSDKVKMPTDIKPTLTDAKSTLTDAKSFLPELEPPFDAAMWKWERELFENFCLKDHFHHEMSPEVRKELEHVAELLEREPKALVHRDFQSTNILWKTCLASTGSAENSKRTTASGERLTIIDFQGMRLGPAAYDLASLVYDPYVEISERDREALVALYAKLSGRPEIVKVTPFAAVQRLCQCLGAYGRLASVGQPQFLKHIVPALQHLLAAADEAGLDAIGALAEDLLK